MMHSSDDLLTRSAGSENLPTSAKESSDLLCVGPLRTNPKILKGATARKILELISYIYV